MTFAQEVPEGARKAYEAAVKHLERPNEADQGLAALKQAIDIFPSYYLALERLGAEYVKRQQYELARARSPRRSRSTRRVTSASTRSASPTTTSSRCRRRPKRCAAR